MVKQYSVKIDSSNIEALVSFLNKSIGGNFYSKPHLKVFKYVNFPSRGYYGDSGNIYSCNYHLSDHLETNRKLISLEELLSIAQSFEKPKSYEIW